MHAHAHTHRHTHTITTDESLVAQTRGTVSGDIVVETAAFVLTLPGKILDISTLNSNHKFRGYGNKDGAVAAIKDLEKSGLGEVIEKKATRKCV